MNKLIIFFLLLFAFPANLLAQTKTVGANGADYPNLMEAFFDINAGNLQGAIILQIIDNITESATAELFESGYGGTSSYTSVTIYPTGSGYKIEGDIDGPLISLNGADSVTFDGRVDASGSAKDLTINNKNTGASASTILFSESASTNTVKYCIIQGSETSAASGVIFFSLATSGSGNDGNTIDHNDITSNTTGRPVNAVYSSGTSGSENSGNTISNNDIFNFLSPGSVSNGIFLSSFTTSCIISGNSFYETTSFNPTSNVTYYGIQINNTSGIIFTVTGNYIGGDSDSCGGTWTKNANGRNNVFYAIFLNVGTSTASSLQDNTIKNFSWSNLGAATWTGIHIAGGALNIGTITPNRIGATTGTGSISVTSTSTGANVYGINIASGGAVDCQNNIIGSITATNSSTLASNITGINKTAAGNTIISYNTIGSTSTANSINATSASTSNAQTVLGINSAGTGTLTISSNTIANLTNGATNVSPSSRGRIHGIVSSNGTNTISSNTIRDLTIANANDASNTSVSVGGIILSGLTLKTVTGNTIYNLSNSYASFTGSVIGLYYIGNTGANIVSGNFIHSLSVTGGSSTTATVYGINIFSGATTYSNNIINLGGVSKTNIYGIYETGAASNNNNLYFNTVYIGGDGNGGTNKSYALYSAVTTNTRDFRNNIFINARSTTFGSNLHYAAYIVSTGGILTCDYNDYQVSGTYGGTLGYYGADKMALPIVTGQDVSSFAINPVFSSPGGPVAANYLPSAATLVAATGTGETSDYDGGAARSSTYPSMGAFEYTVAPGSWTWTGSTGTDWITASNWNYNTVPPSSGNVIITDVANDPIINEAPATPAECQDLTINLNAILTIAAGRALRVNGTITNSGNSGLVIKSDANGNDGKLLNSNSAVPATVELFLSGGTGVSGPAFHYFTPPVQSMAIDTSSIAATATDLGLTNFNGDLILYDETKAIASREKGWQYFDGYGSTTGFTSLTSAKGYNIYLTNADRITFKGQLNGQAHSYNLSYTGTNTDPGWNLVGNPYPCNYDLNGISALTGSGDNVDNTVYFNNEGGYAYWNVLTGGTTGYSDILPPMQGFFVHATASTTINLPLSSKTLTTALPLRSKGAAAADKLKNNLPDPIKKVKLVLNNGSVHDETIVCLIDDATTGFDSDYDAYKLFARGSTSPAIYSELSSVKYAINTVKESAETQTIIPLTLDIKSPGTYHINNSELENLEGTKVVLKHGSVETVLSQYSTYTFAPGAGTYHDFELVIGETNLPTGIETPVIQNFRTWYNNNFLYINPPSEITSEKCKLVIHDLQGKTVFNNNQIFFTPGQTIEVPIGLPKGIYIIQVIANNQPYVSKVVVF